MASESQTLPMITLTTDFGTRDPYVAAMKGVIYSINPSLRVVDLSHEIPPQDVFECALFLAGALPHFPKGTIHVVVVDPGVGTNRRPIAVSDGEQCIVCPDNGLATLYLREHPLQHAHIISNPKLRQSTVSATFHGRDIFAPAGAYLATGTPQSELGDELDVITTLDIPQPTHDARGIYGAVIHVDGFGNLITNIHFSMVEDGVPALVRAGHHRLHTIHLTYSEVPSGSPLALFDSSGYLEIAINCGNAHAALRLDRGDAISIEFPPTV